MIRTVVLAASLSLFALACGASTPAPPSAPATPSTSSAPSSVKEPGEAKVGDTTKCPVSGEEFTVEATSQKVEHDGKTYYFCCGGCKKKFEADPAKYLKKS